MGSYARLHERVKQATPKKAMRFVRALHYLLGCILELDPVLWASFLSKVDLADTHMRIWALLVNTPSVAFLIPRRRYDKDQTAGFHL